MRSTNEAYLLRFDGRLAPSHMEDAMLLLGQCLVGWRRSNRDTKEFGKHKVISRRVAVNTK